MIMKKRMRRTMLISMPPIFMIPMLHLFQLALYLHQRSPGSDCSPPTRVCPRERNAPVGPCVYCGGVRGMSSKRSLSHPLRQYRVWLLPVVILCYNTPSCESHSSWVLHPILSAFFSLSGGTSNSPSPETFPLALMPKCGRGHCPLDSSQACS